MHSDPLADGTPFPNILPYSWGFERGNRIGVVWEWESHHDGSLKIPSFLTIPAVKAPFCQRMKALTPHKLMFPQRGEDWMDLKRQASEIISKQARGDHIIL